MINKNIGLIMKIDGAANMLGGLLVLIFYRPLNELAGLPDITPTLYPRTLGAFMLGLGLIFWQASNYPAGSRDAILSGIIARVLGGAVVYYQVFVSQIILPRPLGLPPIALLLANTIMLFLVAWEALYWWNNRSK
jgi:hypothetical protein